MYGQADVTRTFSGKSDFSNNKSFGADLLKIAINQRAAAIFFSGPLFIGRSKNFCS
jgi:hypothetical protein